jgi:putative ATPase
MVRAGEDPAFIFRRMIILAMEDVGLADPQTITTVISCAEAFDRIGFPEGNFALSEACLCLATAAKSNSTMAFFDALKEVEKEDSEIPAHLKDANRDAESFGHGEGYIYPHAYRDHWAAQAYLPTALRGRVFYSPSLSGYEGRIREEVIKKRELQAAVILGDSIAKEDNADAGTDKHKTPPEDTEILSWSAASKGREGWYKRLESGRSSTLLAERDFILGQLSMARHHRVLIAGANDGLLLWECLRRAPEGLAAALVDSESAKETLLKLSAALDEGEKPQIAIMPTGFLPSLAEAEKAFSCKVFDHIVARELLRRPTSFDAFAVSAFELLAPGGDLSVLQSPPRLGQRISGVLLEECGAEPSLYEKLSRAEDDFFLLDNPTENSSRWTWDSSAFKSSFENAGFTVSVGEIDRSEERLISERDLSAWFDKEKSSWGAFISEALGEEDFSSALKKKKNRIREGPVTWNWKSLLLKASKN